MIDRTGKGGNGRRPSKAQLAYVNGKIDAALAMIEIRLRPPPPAPPSIWAVDVFGTWSRTPDPIHWPDGGCSDEQRLELFEAAGFHPLMARFGERFGFIEVEFFGNEEGQYLAEVIVAERVEHVLLQDLPSLLLFLRDIAPVIAMCRAC